MMKTTFALVVVSLGLLTACDKACKVPTETFGTVDNSTGRDLDIKVCSGATISEKSISLPKSQNGEIVVAKETETHVYTGGGPDACELHQYHNASISLTPESFKQVKLCRRSQPNEAKIVELFESCPQGTEEQLTPANCTTTQ